MLTAELLCRVCKYAPPTYPSHTGEPELPGDVCVWALPAVFLTRLDTQPSWLSLGITQTSFQPAFSIKKQQTQGCNISGNSDAIPGTRNAFHQSEASLCVVCTTTQQVDGELWMVKLESGPISKQFSPSLTVCHSSGDISSLACKLLKHLVSQHLAYIHVSYPERKVFSSP